MPLTRLTRKDVRFVWNDNCKATFLELKHRLTTTPVLTIPNNNDPYVVYIGVSGTSLGCVLM